ncbi:unnamed protein product [Ciceribacter sp. T2.26MG-112.2]|uniref:sensor histidine kinase n=1 Tax=Ciceribacter sp. T2.26MG-112.2 TaxID=3137154 RepID=UPI000E136A8E|nr:sensor histidine kinase [Ciceribacter naphthalenivorans]SSC71015.1 unnamed protein product [Ciceribacter naphthalenivorans]
MRIRNLISRWNSKSLAVQFLGMGGAVSVFAMTVIGTFISNRVEDTVTSNAAATTALYVDSVIAPLLPDMQSNETLDDTTARALDETLGQGALGGRLLLFRLWRSDGTVLYASDPAATGTKPVLEEMLKAAFSGQMVARFVAADEEGDQSKAALPILKIYNPVLQPWSGQVVAVSEFHETAGEFQQSLLRTRLHTWFAVAAFTLVFFVLLSAIVLRGSRTIERQRHALKQRVEELSVSLSQNEALRERVQRATQRATTLNEGYLRRIGADLHDGPAQLLAYAALRLDGEALRRSTMSDQTSRKELVVIKASLDEAMHEIRTICSGLVLPRIEGASLPDILQEAIRAHRMRTGTSVNLSVSTPPEHLSPAAKICIYRFVQEGLNNAYRHAGGIGQAVSQRTEGGFVMVEVADRGSGFDLNQVRTTSLGLAGLRERVESLGGTFEITSSQAGTVLRMTTKIEETK